MPKVLAILFLCNIHLSYQASTGEFIRTRCEQHLECYSTNCARIQELQRCIEQAAAYVAMIMSACLEPNCPKSEADAIDRFFAITDLFKPQ